MVFLGGVVVLRTHTMAMAMLIVCSTLLLPCLSDAQQLARPQKGEESAATFSGGLRGDRKLQVLPDCEGETSYVNDGECDAENNNDACDFDGGDCCECECEDSDYLCGGQGYNCVDPSSECNINDSTCSNGLAGIESDIDELGDRACCPIVCGECGGPVCFFAGLPEFDDTGCCDHVVLNTQKSCDVTGAAPCVIGSTDEAATCSNGLPGFEGTNDNGTSCCPVGCGVCGGDACGRAGAANGLDNTSCCINGVLKNQPSCSVSGAAPCIIDGEQTCSDGTPGFEGTNDNGSACCPVGCTTCGGVDCGTVGKAEGLGNTDCCINGVLNNKDLCSVTDAAPCVL